MKKIILSLMLVALTITAVAQSANNIERAQFPGGLEALAKFLIDNVKYPEAAEAYAVEGKVVMDFVVEKDGSLSEIAAHDCKIERFNTTKFSQETEARQKELKEQFAKLFAKEGARVIRMMPQWIPGKADGKPVRMKLHQPINFKMPL